jgi:hypothetical protein
LRLCFCFGCQCAAIHLQNRLRCSSTKHNYLVPLLVPYHALLVLAALNKQSQDASPEQIYS